VTVSSGDERFLRRALELARVHSADGVHGPFAAVVVRDGEIVGEGWNGVVAERDPTLHGEVAAIRDACARLGTHVLDDCTLYSSCEPCPMCLGAIFWARIPRVVWAAGAADAADAGFDDADIGEELLLGWRERTLESRQLLREEGRALFRAWEENPDRVGY
jgi:tRNA(Arg) A34 adenosine deaminase TadA